MQHRASYQLVTVAFVLAFFVILLGAYTRLTDAGLGCPDWPGCYGHFIVDNQTLSTNQSAKAWTEMLHRYAAGTLGTLIIILFGISLFQRKQNNHPIIIPFFLVTLLIFQALLGMWTVTLKLHPLVVMAHLVGGLILLNLLWCLRLQLKNPRQKIYFPQLSRKINFFAALSLVILIFQITLGVWVSANYAGLSCIGFPWCNGEVLANDELA